MFGGSCGYFTNGMKALPQNRWVRRRAIPRDCGREIRVYEYGFFKRRVLALALVNRRWR